MRFRSTALLCVGLGVLACGRSAFEGESVLSPTPTLTPSPTLTATPTPTPIPTPFFGDGRDGALTVAGADAVVNTCHTLVLGTGSTVVLSSDMGLAEGDRILLMQVQASTAPSAASPTAVDALNANGAGRWELVAVASVASDATTTVTLSTALTGDFHTDAVRVAQACSVPQFTTVIVTNNRSVTAAPWDGHVGGVVAFLAADTLAMSNGGSIDVKRAGFRGGRLTASPNNVDLTALDTTDADGGGKGEGIAALSWPAAGRGSRANAGGGGDARSAGGGGGGGGGDGGFGGMESDKQAESANNRGVGGGQSSILLPDGLLFGGGGGAGQGGGNANQGAAGGAGGGVVFLRVRVSGNADISADGGNGSDGQDDAGGDGNGAGGGGAGGTVLFWATSGTATISAIGGDGGLALDANHKCGPGGGGGGGRLYTRGLSSPFTAPAPGVAGHTPNNAMDIPYGSTDGNPGVVDSN